MFASISLSKKWRHGGVCISAGSWRCCLLLSLRKIGSHSIELVYVCIAICWSHIFTSTTETEQVSSFALVHLHEASYGCYLSCSIGCFTILSLVLGLFSNGPVTQLHSHCVLYLFLKDPSDKRRIISDEKLRELFDVDTFNGFTVSKLLTVHFIKTEQWVALVFLVWCPKSLGILPVSLV